MVESPKGLVLASASPRRKELLERMGLIFEIHSADVDEDNEGLAGPAEMVRENAQLKAKALTSKFSECLVLGSDTTVALEGSILNKPVDLEEAREMLARLSGRAHTVFTSVALIWEDGEFSDVFVESSSVWFREFGPDVIDAYFKVVDPLDKAGAYGIQQGRELIIDRVEGSVENVMGLPIQALEKRLSEHGFDFRV